MSQPHYDWSIFKRRIYIKNCTKEDLFKKWATPKGLTEWFIAEAEYKSDEGNLRAPDEIVQPGDKYKWTFHRGSKVTGTVLESEENSLFKFTFGENEPDSGEDVVVTVTIGESNGTCYFDIVQENMTDSNYSKVYYHISCNMGWAFHMYNLKSIFENGHDLRVTGVKRMHVDAPSGYPLEDYKWTSFQQTEYVTVSLEKIFKKWTTPKGITGWFLKDAKYTSDNGTERDKEEIVKPGDEYEWEFYQGLVLTGKVLEVKENSLFKFTFGKKEPGSDEDVVVSVSFSTRDGQTKIELKQENIADNEYGHVNFNLSCMVGWSFYMTNLRSIYESGFDLREKDFNLAREVTSYNLNKA